MKIELETVTPLWTGGVDSKKADRVHTTGIIGSLRWWYEAILRGISQNICDPSTGNSCQLNADIFSKRLSEHGQAKKAAEQAGLCPVCQVFGATGWARQFRLRVVDLTSKGPFNTPVVTTDDSTRNISRRNPKKRGRPTYYYPEGRVGSFQLEVIPLAPAFQPYIILGLFKLIETQGNLASKGQLGYGLVSINNPSEFDVQQFVQDILHGNEVNAGSDSGLPSLRNMFFAEYDIPLVSNLQTLTNLKYDIRQAFRDGPTSIASDSSRAELRHQFLGWTKGNMAEGAKVFLSRIIDHRIRIWGWVPEKGFPGVAISRDEIITHLRSVLDRNGSCTRWRELNSPRDTGLQTSDYVEYLKSLL